MNHRHHAQKIVGHCHGPGGQKYVCRHVCKCGHDVTRQPWPLKWNPYGEKPKEVIP